MKFKVGEWGAENWENYEAVRAWRHDVNLNWHKTGNSTLFSFKRRELTQQSIETFYYQSPVDARETFPFKQAFTSLHRIIKVFSRYPNRFRWCGESFFINSIVCSQSILAQRRAICSRFPSPCTCSSMPQRTAGRKFHDKNFVQLFSYSCFELKYSDGKLHFSYVFLFFFIFGLTTFGLCSETGIEEVRIARAGWGSHDRSYEKITQAEPLNNDELWKWRFEFFEVFWLIWNLIQFDIGGIR